MGVGSLANTSLVHLEILILKILPNVSSPAGSPEVACTTAALYKTGFLVWELGYKLTKFIFIMRFAE